MSNLNKEMLYRQATLRLTPSNKKGTLDAKGFIKFRLGLWLNNKEVGNLTVRSGQPGIDLQVLRKCSSRNVGSGQPIGEGIYKLGDSDAVRGLNWASGRPYDYSVDWEPGVGPVWMGIHEIPGYVANIDYAGIHADFNSPGTLGCIGITSQKDLETFVSWATNYLYPLVPPKGTMVNPTKFLVVDYFLGSVPRPK